MEALFTFQSFAGGFYELGHETLLFKRQGFRLNIKLFIPGSVNVQIYVCLYPYIKENGSNNFWNLCVIFYQIFAF